MRGNIVQAAGWMQAGKDVRRYIWSADTCLCLNMDHVTIMLGTGDGRPRPYELSIIDLLAEDWEIRL